MSFAPKKHFKYCESLASVLLYLVDIVSLAELVERCVHGVQHRNNGQRRDFAAYSGEAYHVAEENGYTLEHLEERGRS